MSSGGSMLVCHCFAVTHRTIDRAVADGARTVDDVAEASDAGAGCGGCHLAVCARIGAAHRGDCGAEGCQSAAAALLAG